MGAARGHPFTSDSGTRLMQESPIFVKTYDFLVWLMQRTESFPRSQRFVLTKRLQDSMFEFYEALIDAGMASKRRLRGHLHAADVALTKTRHYIRMVRDLTWLTPKQYQYASAQLTEIGNLLGGWIKTTNPA